jgi:hypothetical protein
MSKVTGQVWKVFDKPFRGKVLYSIRLENDPIYYRMNENRNAGVVEPGNYVEFEADTNPDGKSANVKGAIKRVEAAPAPAATPAAGAGWQGGGNPNREHHIHYQSARKDALTFVQIALTSGAIALPAKASAKLAAVEALVDSYTALYLEDVATGGAVTRTTERAYAEEQANEAPVPQPGKPKKAPRVPEPADEDGFDEDDDE